MATSAAQTGPCTDAQIDELLLDLNSRVKGADQLRAWASGSRVGIDRPTATSALTCIRLARPNAEGVPIVPMPLDSVWRRAL